MQNEKDNILELMQEAKELRTIVAKLIVTSKENR
jgi:hypothetical protein